MKKGIHTALMVIQGLLALVCIGYCTYIVLNGSGGQQWPAAVCLPAVLMTLDYAVRGYRKTAVRAYRIMLVFCALASLLCLVPHTFNVRGAAEAPVASALCAIAYAMSFSAYLLIAFVPDLGKARSAVLHGFIFLAHLAVFICCLILQPRELIGNGTIFDSMRAARHISILALAINAAICTWFKYSEKAERHEILRQSQKRAKSPTGGDS